MKGTIRILLGLLIVMGAVGGMEMETATMGEGILLALGGLGIMAWGVEAAKEEGGLQ